MKYLVVVPTFNERENIVGLLAKITEIGLPVDVLVVDDNSPDGTAGAVRSFQSGHKGIFLLERSKKKGLGGAYLAGFDWGLKNGYAVLVQMDADFSHNPVYLPEIIDKIKRYDFIIGSRYVLGGGLENWGHFRRLLSRGGNFYARLVLGTAIADFTGGFNAWRAEVLRGISLNKVCSNGYGFQAELKYRAAKNEFSFLEIPIIFTERKMGKSKMNFRIVREALWRLPVLRFKKVREIRQRD